MSRESRKKKKTEEEEALEKLPADVRARKEAYDWIQSLMVALIVCVCIFIFCIRVIDVSGSSMNPTLYNGDKMLVSHILYKPHAGDVVVFRSDTYDPNKALVKRVIATEGQEINIDFSTGTVYIDGEAIEEDYIAELTRNKLDFIGPKTVPSGCVFVLGDNRNDSLDSRFSEIGFIRLEEIAGKAVCRLFSFDPIK